MKREEVSAVGLPSGAKAVGLVRWMPLRLPGGFLQDEAQVIVLGQERTDYLVSTDGNGFVIVGLSFRPKVVRYADAASAKVWYW